MGDNLDRPTKFFFRLALEGDYSLISWFAEHARLKDSDCNAPTFGIAPCEVRKMNLSIIDSAVSNLHVED
jgi:hypothetical protein